MQLLSEAVVAIDGSKVKAVNNRDRNSPSRKSSRGGNTWRRDLEKRSGVSALSSTGNQCLPSPDSMDSSAQSVLVAPRGRAGILDGREHTGGYLELAERIIC